MVFIRVVTVISNIRECRVKVGFIVLCLSLLNDDHISYRLYDVKLLYIDSEFSLLDLSEIKHVLNHELEAE